MSPYRWRMSRQTGIDGFRVIAPSGTFPVLSPSVTPAYVFAGRDIGLTPTCSAAVYGAP